MTEAIEEVPREVLELSASDALRLAVMLQFDLSLGHGGATVRDCNGQILAQETCPAGGDSLACACRAINRAAAEVGA